MAKLNKERRESINLIVAQKRKELFAAEFAVLSEAGAEEGEISLHGGFASMEGTFRIRYGIYEVEVYPIRRQEAVDHGQEYIRTSPYRPYAVRGNCPAGFLFHDQYKIGFMKTAAHHFLLLRDSPYYLYYLGFGEKEICAPVYLKDTYIGEITKPCLVENDLHVFDLWLPDGSNPLPLLCLCCYMYVITFYKAGQKIVRGTSKHVYTTKNEYMIRKCRNSWYLNGS